MIFWVIPDIWYYHHRFYQYGKRRSERTKAYKVNYEDILNAIDNIPPCFEETKENIIKTIENYLEKDKALQSYDNERFYKVGFIDAIRLMLGAQNFKRD